MGANRVHFIGLILSRKSKVVGLLLCCEGIQSSPISTVRLDWHLNK
ncbi:hypothetical protein Prudu_006234 [Prunus dulcis]|uniref:Uncharacterized protein n=1 Tax=Prunus dulcis TaxID=3755 RepID=A0A4Y1QZB9_PRUDU|nr:hypothetical protein Prudu_006234 [Prunus dulcis]